MEWALAMDQNSALENKLVEKSNWFANRRLDKTSRERIQTMVVPDSLKEAYCVQQRVLEKLGWHVGGWKLGGTNQGTRNKFDCNSAYYGPIEEGKIIFGETENSFEWELPSSLRGEAEISFRLSPKIDQLRELDSLEDVFGYVDALAPSLECPYCTIVDVESLGLGALIADLCGSGYLILGKIVPINPAALMCNQIIEISQLQNSAEIGSTVNIIGFPIQALFEFLNLAFEHQLDLRAGQWIATGGCTSCVELIPNSPVILKFENIESFQVVIKCENGN